MKDNSEINMEEVLAEFRQLAGEQAQTIVLLKAFNAKLQKELELNTKKDIEGPTA